jgi:sRNA-binding regulator protein Hfq
MQIKLLKKVRKVVKIFYRNGAYTISNPIFKVNVKDKKEAFDWYYIMILTEAKSKFGYKPKKRIR